MLATRPSYYDVQEGCMNAFINLNHPGADRLLIDSIDGIHTLNIKFMSTRRGYSYMPHTFVLALLRSLDQLLSNSNTDKLTSFSLLLAGFSGQDITQNSYISLAMASIMRKIQRFKSKITLTIDQRLTTPSHLYSIRDRLRRLYVLCRHSHMYQTSGSFARIIDVGLLQDSMLQDVGVLRKHFKDTEEHQAMDYSSYKIYRPADHSMLQTQLQSVDLQEFVKDFGNKFDVFAKDHAYYLRRNRAAFANYDTARVILAAARSFSENTVWYGIPRDVMLYIFSLFGESDWLNSAKVVKNPKRAREAVKTFKRAKKTQHELLRNQSYMHSLEREYEEMKKRILEMPKLIDDAKAQVAESETLVSDILDEVKELTKEKKRKRKK
jgi:hypothetical protein